MLFFTDKHQQNREFPGFGRFEAESQHQDRLFEFEPGGKFPQLQRETDVDIAKSRTNRSFSSEGDL